MSTSSSSDPGASRAGAGLAPGELEALVGELRGEVARLRKRVERLEGVAEAAQSASFWDFSVYEQVPDERWVAIDREDATRILLALEGVDNWRPWRTPIEPRPS